MPRNKSVHVSKGATAIADTNYEELERNGDEKLVSGDYGTAVENYTRALRLKPDNAVVLSNRSQAYINLEQYRLGLRDAEASLKLIEGENRKAVYRRAKALYGLKLYQESSDVLEKLQLLQLQPSKPLLPPSDKEIRELCQRVKHRVDEQLNGRYQLTSMLKEAEASTRPHLDHAEYIGPVRVVEIQGKGRGMIATRKILAGELLLCSKAYAIVFDEERKSRRDISPADHLVLKIVEKLEREPGTAGELYKLYAGPDMPPVNVLLDATDRLQIDTERIRHIVRHNSFETAVELWSSLDASRNASVPQRDESGSGLWIQPSFINHSCLSNARYNSIGDFMFVRAINDIADGEEVSVTYIDPLDTYSERTDRLVWRGFECQCLLCTFAREQPDVANARERLQRQFQQIRPGIKMGDDSMMPQLRTIIASIRKTFKTDSPASSPPPIELFRPLSALSHLHTVVGQFDKAVNALLEAFESLPRLGGNTSTSIARTDIAWRLRSMYKMLGKLTQMKKWNKKAREEFKIIYGGDDDKLWQNYVDDYESAHT